METNNLINIPLEFKVACTLTKVTIQQVLQLFIDHVSLYDCISPYYNQGFSEASRTMAIYAETKPKRPDSYEIFNIDIEAATKLIAKLTKLGLRKTGIVQKPERLPFPTSTNYLPSWIGTTPLPKPSTSTKTHHSIWAKVSVSSAKSKIPLLKSSWNIS